MFIKGRTFSPKLAINISIAQNRNNKSEIIIVTFKAGNIGNVRISPKSASAKIFYGRAIEGKIKFMPLEEVTNLFSFYYSEKEKFHIEPKDEMRIDVPLLTEKIIEDHPEHNLSNVILSVNVEIEDFFRRLWKENAILHLSVVDEKL